jgi:hypothetical protein
VEGAHQDQVFLLLGEGGGGRGGWREAREKRENLVSASCERERDKERKKKKEIVCLGVPTRVSWKKPNRICYTYVPRKERHWPLLFFASLCW